jgi:hypothetical protein
MDPEIGPKTTNHNNAMSRTEKEKAAYIQKEQSNRYRMMENDNQNTRHFLQIPYPSNRTPTLSIQSTVTEDFQEQDWTPQDSSYGAAFPCCGWVPKSIRQTVEKFLLAVAGVFVIYTIVTIAVLLLGDGESESGNANNFNVDDNFYNYIYDDFYVKDQNNGGDDDVVTDDDADDYF